MQQIESAWKSTANLELLLGPHPLATLEKPILHANDPTSAATVPLVDARNTIAYRAASYGGAQDLTSARCRKTLVAYYRDMLSKVSLWSAVEAAEAVKSEDGSSVVKAEQADDVDGSTPSSLGAPLARSGRGGPTFRALGIITQTPDPFAVGEALLAPWEFYMISDLEDESQYLPALHAMTKDVSMNTYAFLHASGEAGAAKAATDLTSSSPDPTQEEQHLYGSAHQRVSLFTRLLENFTGVYSGIAVGVIGDPFQRDARGGLSGVLVRQLVLPHRPQLPWHLAAPVLPASAPLVRRPTRVHFCSGPFPLRDVLSVLKAVVRQALHRGADVLIVGGPLISMTDVPDMERELIAQMKETFSDFVNRVFEALTEQLAQYYSLHPLVPHMKIILVAHRSDVTQIPVLPTTMYDLADEADVWVRSNPVRIAINGVHFGVCNEDIVGKMRRVMVERWSTAEGSLRRVVESVVQSRYYTPILELPAAKVDLKYLPHLRLDYLPQVDPSNTAPTRIEENWSKAYGEAAAAAAVAAGTKDESEVAAKRTKVETKTEASDADVKPTLAQTAGESMPHILFLPSTVPKFAVVTHRGILADEAAPRAPHVKDEAPIDDTEHATGVLVVNQEVWSKRGSGKFELRVAEVTIADPEVVARRGASAATGVSCGVLHIYNNPI